MGRLGGYGITLLLALVLRILHPVAYTMAYGTQCNPVSGWSVLHAARVSADPVRAWLQELRLTFARQPLRRKGTAVPTFVLLASAFTFKVPVVLDDVAVWACLLVSF